MGEMRFFVTIRYPDNHIADSEMESEHDKRYKLILESVNILASKVNGSVYDIEIKEV
jgi:hypothetical protein